MTLAIAHTNFLVASSASLPPLLVFIDKRAYLFQFFILSYRTERSYI
jgi:hypothetical protein